MHQEKLYAHKNFIDFIKKFDWYEDELLALHDKVMHRHDSWKSFFKKKFSDQVIAALVSERNRIVNARRDKRKREVEATVIKNNFQSELLGIQGMVNEQQELHEIANTYNLHNKNHYETRLAALEDVLNSRSCTQQSYSFNNDALTLLSQVGCSAEQYKTNYGNQLQQVIHRECIDIVSQAAQLSVHSPLYDYKNSLVNFTDSARSYNQEGSSGRAMQINDFCYALLDYGSAIVEGIACGVIGAAKDMINHPVQTALCVVAGEYVLAYQLLKVTTNLASIGISYAFDKEAGEQQWHEYIEPITSVISAIKNKELTLRDGIKGAVTLGTGMYAQGKMLKGLNSFYNTTKAKALEFAKNNPLVTPFEYMTTQEGVLFKVTDKTSKTGPWQQNDIEWIPYGHKHIASKKMSWKDILQFTKNGPAKYKPEINVELLETMAWQKGTMIPGKNWKIYQCEDIIGANNGIETNFMIVKNSMATIHGHPITPQEFKQYMNMIGKL